MRQRKRGQQGRSIVCLTIGMTCPGAACVGSGARARACSPEQVDLAPGPRPTTTRWLVRSPVMLRFSPRSSRGSSCENAARLPAAARAASDRPLRPWTTGGALGQSPRRDEPVQC